MNLKVLVIVGPTASGKSDLAVKLAKRLNGEVVSADSRQVYRGLDIGTGKIAKKEMQGVRHHLLDVSDPKKRFTVIQYRALAEKAIAGIVKRGKLPIICGGTGFYIDALMNGIEFPIAGADKKLRAKLANNSADELFEMIKRLDPMRAAKIAANNSERHNRRRLIRAIEIAQATKMERQRAVSKAVSVAQGGSDSASALPSLQHKYDALWIGIKPPSENLKKNIHLRLLKRLKSGMIAEAEGLHAQGLSWKRMEELGLEYRYLSRYLRNIISMNLMLTELETEIWHYAKRQMTWFKRNRKIRWYTEANCQLTDSIKRVTIEREP